MFAGESRLKDAPALPTVARGADINSIVSAFMSVVDPVEWASGNAEIDPDAMNEALAKLPTEPDERLK